jgi:hypothetical protein
MTHGTVRKLGIKERFASSGLSSTENTIVGLFGKLAIWLASFVIKTGFTQIS